MRTHGHCGVSPFPLHQQRSRPAVAVVDEVLPLEEVEGAEVTLVDVAVPPAPVKVQVKVQVKAPRQRHLQVALREVAEAPAEAVAAMEAAEQLPLQRPLRRHLLSRPSICD